MLLFPTVFPTGTWHLSFSSWDYQSLFLNDQRSLAELLVSSSYESLWLLASTHPGLDEGLKKRWTNIFCPPPHTEDCSVRYNLLGVYGVISVETYCSLSICSGPGGEEVRLEMETGGEENPDGKWTRASLMGICISVIQATDSPREKNFFPAVMAKEKINFKRTNA